MNFYLWTVKLSRKTLFKCWLQDKIDLFVTLISFQTTFFLSEVILKKNIYFVQIVEKVNDVLQNILFCVLQKKEKHAGVQWHAFWVNRSFKLNSLLQPGLKDILFLRKHCLCWISLNYASVNLFLSFQFNFLWVLSNSIQIQLMNWKGAISSVVNFAQSCYRRTECARLRRCGAGNWKPS